MASHLGNGFEFDLFVQQLIRLAPDQPERTANILGLIISSMKRDYDRADHLRDLLVLLAQAGQRERMIEYANKLVSKLPGMLEVYNEMRLNKP